MEEIAQHLGSSTDIECILPHQRIVAADGTSSSSVPAIEMIDTLCQLDARPRHAEFVYFALGFTTKRIKIGWSRDPRRREKELQQGASESICLVDVLPGTSRLEAYFHHHFADYRVIGEWFDGSCAVELFELIERMAFATERLSPEENDWSRAIASGIDDGRLKRDYWKLSRTDLEMALMRKPRKFRDLWDPRLN